MVILNLQIFQKFSGITLKDLLIIIEGYIDEIFER